MEIRCGSCNKLFRVADEKITGTGIKFACTRCGNYVKITRQDFEQYTLSKAAAPVPPIFEPSVPTATFETAKTEATSGYEPAAAVPERGPEPPLPPAAEAPPIEPSSPATKPTPTPEPEHILPPEPALKQEQEAKPVAPASRPEPLRPPTPAASRPEPMPSAVRPAATGAEVFSAGSLAPASPGKKYLILALLLAVLFVGAFFILRSAGYNVFRFTRSASKGAEVAPKGITSPEGLQITSASGALDQNRDLVISGMIGNTTDKERPAWYVVVHVYDAQGAVLMNARMLNGKQLYTKKDYEILAKRRVNIQELKAKNLQEPGVTIPPKGSVPFEIRFMEPPVGVSSFNAELQPFDPEQLFKEMAEEQK